MGQLQMLKTVYHCAFRFKKTVRNRTCASSILTVLYRSTGLVQPTCERLQVYKEGSPVGQPLMSSSGHTGDQMEATLWRYIKTSKPS